MYSIVLKLCIIAMVAVLVSGCMKKLDPNQDAPKKAWPPAPAVSAPAKMFGFAAPGTQGKLLESASTGFKVKQGALGGDAGKNVATSASFKLRGNFYGL